MTNLLSIICLFIIFFSCNTKNSATIELTFTSRNSDTIIELKSFHLTNFSGSNIKEPENQSFQNIKSYAANKFSIKNVKPGLYFGLIEGVYKHGTFNVTYDSIRIRPGINYLTKEINLSSSKLINP